MFTEQKVISALSHSDVAHIKLPFRSVEKKE